MGTILVVQEEAAARTTVRAPGQTREKVAATAPEATATPAEPTPALDPETAREFARQVQEALDRVAPTPHEIAFRRDEATNGFVIEVRNPDGSVIRQYPPEKLLNLRRKLDEMSGMVIDQMT